MPVLAAVVFAVLSCFRIAAADETARCTVRLFAQASVKSTALVLADVADLSGEDAAMVTRLARISLGPITDVRLVSRSEILSAIRSAFPNPEDVLVAGADFTRVSVATRSPDAAEIAAILKTHLASVTPWREEEIEIRSIDNLNNVVLPQENIQLRVSGRGVPANYRNALLPLEALLDGKLLRIFWIKADVRVRARVVQVARPVPYRSALQADDVREILSDIEDPRDDYVRSSAEAVGMTAKRALSPGVLLSRGFLNEICLVRSGEIVRLVVQSDGISITTRALALQSGKLGDRVKVRNLDSDRAITAVVTGQGEVQVAH